MAEKKTGNGGRQARIGFNFLADIEAIKDKRLLNGKSKERISTEKITNMITRHNLWKNICGDIIEASEEELNKHGK